MKNKKLNKFKKIQLKNLLVIVKNLNALNFIANVLLIVFYFLF